MGKVWLKTKIVCELNQTIKDQFEPNWTGIQIGELFRFKKTELFPHK